MRIRGWLPLAVAGIAGVVQAGDLRSDFVQQWPLQVAQSDADESGVVEVVSEVADQAVAQRLAQAPFVECD